MGAGRDRDGDRATTGQTCYAVPEAAEVLGIIAESVRSRIKRETLPTDREAGAVFVVLEAERASISRPTGRPGPPR
jgi:hypothetical protein